MIQGSWMSIFLWLITACIASIFVSFSHSNFKPKLSKKILVCVLIALVLVIPAYVTCSSMDYQSLAQNVATQKEITYFKNVLGRSYNYTELIRWENQHIVYSNNMDKRPSDPIEILEYGKGKCREFAILYAALSISQGYRCRIVDFPLNDHAINEVKINGSWISVDASANPQGYVNNPLIYEREGQPPRILALAFEGSSIVDVTATYRSDHLSILLSPLTYFFVIVASWLSFCIYLIWKKVQWKRDIFKRRI